MVLLFAVYRIAEASTASPEQTEHGSPLHVLPTPVLIILAFGCLSLAACVAGLTLGLMSLDNTALEIVMQSTNTPQAAAARAIKPLREQGNLLLVTLLFANTLATELLPLVLEALVPGGYFSLVVSVVSVMLFGEIIPQAVCSRHPLLIGARLAGFVKVLRTILYPVSAPIAFALDAVLGEELATVYNREELKGLIDVHMVNKVLTQDETIILKGALEFSQKTVSQILTPAMNVFKLDIDTKLDRSTLLSILRSGHSRIPLYESNPNNIVCLLLVKQLVMVNPEDRLPIRALMSNKKNNHKIRVAPALECSGSALIADLLNEFQKGRSHMAIVYNDICKPVEEREFLGIVSIEDIIEEILQEEIVDETDTYVDNTRMTKVLVRNQEGQLVRSTGHSPHLRQLSSSSKASLIREVDPQILRSQSGPMSIVEAVENDPRLKGKIPGKPPVVPSKAPSVSDPLLTYRFLDDLESQAADATQAEVSAAPAQPSRSQEASVPRNPLLLNNPRQTASYPNMQYASFPTHSMLSLIGEDDNVMPEDCAIFTPEYRRPCTDASSSGAVDSETMGEDRESSVQLKVRPLPDDASDERVVQIPPRLRSASSRRSDKRTSRHFKMASYGTLTDPTNSSDQGQNVEFRSMSDYGSSRSPSVEWR